LQLLTGTKQTLEEGDIRIEMKPVTTQMQMSHMAMAQSGMPGVSDQMTMLGLRQCVEAVYIDGEKFDPVELANKINLGDRQSRNEFRAIGKLIDKALFPPEDDETKKE